MVAAACSLVLLGGCSFVFVRGPGGAAGDGAPPACTSLPVAPVIDTALAGAGVVASVAAHRKLSDLSDGDRALNRDFLRIQRDWAGVGALFEIGAAVYGFVKTARCRRAQRTYAAPAGRPGG